MDEFISLVRPFALPIAMVMCAYAWLRIRWARAETTLAKRRFDFAEKLIGMARQKERYYGYAEAIDVRKNSTAWYILAENMQTSILLAETEEVLKLSDLDSHRMALAALTTVSRDYILVPRLRRLPDPANATHAPTIPI